MFRLACLPFAAFLFAGPLAAQPARVLFDAGPAAPLPFPSDTVTVPDAAQKTGLRMNLPLPDCQAEPGTCQELALINELDGFSLNPRIRVRFSAPVDVETLRAGLFFVWLDNLAGEFGLHEAGHVTPVNQVLYDPRTNTAYAKPDEVLYQHRRYALVVTSAVRDAAGQSVSADAAFDACLAQTAGYCARLREAVEQAAPGFAPERIVAASVFTTLSATAWLESARDQLRNAPPAYRFERIFDLSSIAALTLHPQSRISPAAYSANSVPLSALAGVGRLAFGAYRSPRFLDARQAIAARPTGWSVPLPDSTEELAVAAFLPATPAPPGGYPVVIFGHASGGNFFHSVDQLASSLAAQGFATIGITAIGHGGGPLSKATVRETSGRLTEVNYPGRAADMDKDGGYSENEGCFLWGLAGQPKLATRDCARQTALDQMQLVRAIQAGLDLTGDGVADLDATRIHYVGWSMGTYMGTLLMAVEPAVSAAVLNSAAGSLAATRLWRHQPEVAAARTPSLLNRGGDYDPDYVLRYRPVELIDVDGALELQEFFERLEWAQMPGDPLAYAAHLRQSTLAGVPVKNVLFQFAIGDRTLPNPTQSAMVRAANVSESTLIYRHDLARELMPDLAADPHEAMWPFYVYGTNPDGQRAIGLMIQRQIAEFLASGGLVVPDLNPAARALFGRDLFQIPQVPPEDLNL